MTTLATGINTVKVGDKKKKKTNINKTLYYNYNKKRHYANKCPEFQKPKKQVSVLVTFISITSAKKDVLKYIIYIYFSVWFKKDITEVQTLINSGSEVNTMVPVYTKKLGLRMQKTNIEALKINGSILETYSIVIAGF